jgi:hypothetical protein
MDRVMPLVQLFFDLQNKVLVRGFNNTIQSSFPSCFQGDTLTLQMRFMNPTGDQVIPYADVDESGAFVQVAIGTIAGLPTAGTFKITDPDAPQTTSAIAFNATAATVQAAIVAALTTNWSTATVTGNAGGPWTITNGANAARSSLTLNGVGLIPTSQGVVEVQAAGSGSTPAIQWFKLMLSPVAYQNSWTAYPVPAVTISNIQTGGVTGSNSIQGIALNNQPYAGTFTVSFGGQTTAPIAYNATTAAVQAALQALSSIGSNNCSVGGTVGTYVITFIGSLGGAAQAPFTASATGLTGPLMLTGTLSLATVGIEEAVGEAQFINQTFEVNVTPSGGAAQTILQTGIQIANDLIPGAPANPTPTAVYLTEVLSDARYLKLDGTNSPLTGDVDMGTNTLVNVEDPTNPQDVATKNYVDSRFAIRGIVKTANFTAADGAFYQIDSSGGAITVQTPSSPVVGDAFNAEDATFSWATHNFTIHYNGTDKINGGVADYVASVAGNKLSIFFISTAYGWSIK